MASYDPLAAAIIHVSKLSEATCTSQISLLKTKWFDDDTITDGCKWCDEGRLYILLSELCTLTPP